MTRAESLQRQLEERQDHHGEYLRLRLERAVHESDYDEIEAALKSLPSSPARMKDPLTALYKKLEAKLENILTVAEDKRLQQALAGEQSSPETWTILLSHIQAVSVQKIAVPKVTGPSANEKIRARMLIELLTKMANLRREGSAPVSAKELRKAIQGRTPAAVKTLLDSLPDA